MVFLKPGNRIYHYCKLSTALNFILPEMKLLLNQIIKTNDPRENKDFNFAATYWSSDNSSKLNNRNKEISQLLREDCKVLCFSTDYKHFFGSNLSSMWAHYGDNHKGLCLELDRNEFIKENKDKIQKGYFKEMIYYEFNPKLPIRHKMVDFTAVEDNNLKKYIKGDFRKKHLDYLYFTKNKEWNNEHEIRLIYFSNNDENEYCLIKKSLKNIHLGIDFEDKNLPIINTLANDKDIYKMKYGDVGLISIPLTI